MIEDDPLEQRVRFGELFDLYSSLLTEKQRMACEFVLRDDLTVAELGAELGMSRQGAHDLLRRARESLEAIEENLKLGELRMKYEVLVQAVRTYESALPEEFVAEISGLLAAEGESADV